MESRHEPAHRPCGKAGEYQEREYLGQDTPECCDECDAGLRVEQRYCERNHNGYCKVDDYGVHNHLSHVTSQLAGYNCACGGGGAYHAEHGRLKQDAVPQYPGCGGGVAVHGQDHGKA